MLRTGLGAQMLIGLLGPAGFAADSNAEIFMSSPCALQPEPSAQAPIGILGPAGLAADGNA